jgi:dipeptidyl aminopeptidase/acylaminoacyl peptidase
MQVDEVAWSPDGLSLAVTGRESSELGVPASIYLYSLSTRKAIAVLRGTEKDHVATLEYSHPTWSPDGSELAAVSKSSEDRWANSGALEIFTLRTSAFRTVTKEQQLELYVPRFFWLPKLGLVIENTVRAETNLFQVNNDTSVTALTRLHGDTASFSFSSSGNEAAFVHSDLQHAPEIHVTNFPFRDTKPVTTLNVSGAPAPLSELVHWSGAGGVKVDGLLMKPPDYARGRRYPLLVMVHGGPGVAVKDSYEPYSLFSEWAWPYPFRIFAQHGYLVFFPNYRGTGSFGKSFRTFHDMAGEPADDIVTGIEALIRRGDVDPALIGILGHSHGGWLGPYVLTHHKEMFKAASFAEGALDAISQYGLLPGWLNLYTHEYYNPGTPYENLRRYVEMSPVFAMKDLNAPVLLEFGQRSLALLGLETVTALWREGVRHEMVVYPGEGHNLAAPQAQLESAYRNLDWFDYWMLGKKASSPNRQEQYTRWEKMAAEMKKMRETHSLPQ